MTKRKIESGCELAFICCHQKNCAYFDESWFIKDHDDNPVCSYREGAYCKCKEAQKAALKSLLEECGEMRSREK